MLTHLRIRNLIVVEEATLELAPGLNVLSGETGAGKSVLLAALALVTGARARTDWIRPDADRAVVEGFFMPSRSVRAALEAQGIEAGEEGLSLRRELRADGRSQAWCEGFPLSVGRLKTLGALLLERQDQHGQLALASEDAQRALVDAAADNRPLLERYAQELEAVRGLRRQEEQLAARLAALREDEDYLRFQLDEIDALAPEPGEREALEQAERRLRNAARLGETYRTLLQRLEGGSGLLEGLGALEGLLERLERLGDVPVDLDLAAVSAPLEELAATLRNRAEDGLLEARRGEDLAERLGRLSALERKHGRDLEAILAWAAEQRELLAQLDDQDALLAERAQVRAEAEAALSRTAAELSKRRRSAAAALGKAWQERLGLLGLERATLRIDVKQEPDPDGWLEIAGKRLRAGPEGADRVEVRIRTNPDLPEGGLGEVPSGGELSRIAFARHLIADRASEPAAPTLILDEVDAGIGADLAGALAEQLEALAGRRQILLVTHQPRLAAVAQRQFCVRKDFGEQRTRTRVVVVEGPEREQEIARMLGEAEPGRETRALAKRLLAAAGRGA